MADDWPGPFYRLCADPDTCPSAYVYWRTNPPVLHYHFLGSPSAPGMNFHQDLSGLDPEKFPPGDDEWAGSYISVKAMPDGRAWCLMSLTFGRLRIVIGEDWSTCGEHWCYDDNVKAVASYVAGPEATPTGWSRHMRPDYTFEYPE